MLLCCFKEKGRPESPEFIINNNNNNCSKKRNKKTKTIAVEAEEKEKLVSKLPQEKAPLNKEEKRLIKQRSRESLRSKNEMPFIDQRPVKSERVAISEEEGRSRVASSHVVVVEQQEVQQQQRAAQVTRGQERGRTTFNSSSYGMNM